MSRLVTVAEAAREAEVSERVVRAAINDGELSAEKVGAQWMIDPDDLNAWIAEMDADEEGGDDD
jgi:excisionase family DNA binding protein